MLLSAGCTFKKPLLLPQVPATPAPPNVSTKNIDPLQTRIVVSVRKQKLYLFEDNTAVKSYDISTARNGVGNIINSNKTPLGLHRIYKKIGAGEPIGRIFKGREALPAIEPILVMPPLKVAPRYMTTRILWLEGLEPGKNQGSAVDTRARFIYIHGTNLEGAIGKPDSFGCIYMKNKDIVELFELVVEGTIVEIKY